MRYLALGIFTVAFLAACEDDDIVNNPNPDGSGDPQQPGNDIVPEDNGGGFECLPNGSAPEPLSEGAFWQFAANGAICLNDPFDPLGPGLGCINPGAWDRPTAGAQFRGDSIGKYAMDCACAWQMGEGSTGTCDLVTATGLDYCAGAPWGVTLVVYAAPYGPRCIAP